MIVSIPLIPRGLKFFFSSQGYDIDALLGKQLRPMICYVTECSKQIHEGMATHSFNLEQIQIHQIPSEASVAELFRGCTDALIGEQ